MIDRRKFIWNIALVPLGIFLLPFKQTESSDDPPVPLGGDGLLLGRARLMPGWDALPICHDEFAYRKFVPLCPIPDLDWVHGWIDRDPPAVFSGQVCFIDGRRVRASNAGRYATYLDRKEIVFAEPLKPAYRNCQFIVHYLAKRQESEDGKKDQCGNHSRTLGVAEQRD